ncbi:MAG: DUF485 domain-containing protein [Pirellulaceae bacterium]|jgi:uncharacterized membrane protein (DUF485 family)|nr:DUF485 domain-containing protein [Pirellulaceae bacterium]HJN10968.1 DUF485 domain-containing protein [Pirellulaceae bacterium]
MEAHNARIGIILFAVYSVFYGSFVLLNAFAPDVMEIKPFAGINLAILYGFALIVFALLLSLIYGVMCQTDGTESADSEGQK